jgi:hypothetical protein
MQVKGDYRLDSYRNWRPSIGIWSHFGKPKTVGEKDEYIAEKSSGLPWF